MQHSGQPVLAFAYVIRGPRTDRQIGGIEQHGAKDYGDCRGADSGRDKGSHDGSNGGCDLQKHSNAHVAIAFTHVGSCSARRGCDHRNQRRSNGVPDVHMKNESQQRHNNNAATKTGERAEEPSEKGAKRHQSGKKQDGHY